MSSQNSGNAVTRSFLGAGEEEENRQREVKLAPESKKRKLQLGNVGENRNKDAPELAKETEEREEEVR